MAMLAEIAEIYRASKKKKDINLWTEWVCRPPAAVLVYLLRNTRVTPNQVTFLSFFIAAGSAAMFVLGPGYGWLLAGALIFEVSFIFDCADGQLARIRGATSVLGHLLDFLMDEIKALLIFASIAARLYLETADELFVYAGLGGMFAIASGLMLTSFIRRPEYGAAPPTADGQPVELASRRGLGRAIDLIERAGRFVVHYPAYIWLLAALDRIDIFFWAYAGVNVLYFGRTFLGLLVRTAGKPAPEPEPEI